MGAAAESDISGVVDRECGVGNRHDDARYGGDLGDDESDDVADLDHADANGGEFADFSVRSPGGCGGGYC